MTADPAQRLLDAIRQLPRRERLRLVERVVHELAEEQAAPPSGGEVIGLFADEAELVEAVAEEAMQARERDPLRAGGG